MVSKADIVMDMASLAHIAEVERAFYAAVASPDVRQWRLVSILAGSSSIRMAADGDLFAAAMMEGIADEAHRQMAAIIKEDEA